MLKAHQSLSNKELSLRNKTMVDFYISVIKRYRKELLKLSTLIVAYGLLVTAVVTLLKYVRRGHLYIFGGALIAHGIYMTFLEMMINIAFSEKTVLQLNWSYFPLFGCFILGMGLIIVAINKPIQESLKKKFFV